MLCFCCLDTAGKDVAREIVKVPLGARWGEATASQIRYETFALEFGSYNLTRSPAEAIGPPPIETAATSGLPSIWRSPARPRS